MAKIKFESLIIPLLEKEGPGEICRIALSQNPPHSPFL